MEIDVVAESLDGSSLLFGEVKWTQSADVSRIRDDLERKASPFPHTGSRQALLAAWLPKGRRRQSLEVITPRAVLDALQ